MELRGTHPGRRRLHAFRHGFKHCVRLLALGLGTGCSGVPGPEKAFVKYSTIDTTTEAHATTRQFQRKVFHIRGRWIIFHSDGENCYTRSSHDGVAWSDPDTVERGFGSSSSIDVIQSDTNLYYFTSRDEDPEPEKWRMILYAGKGVVGAHDLVWGDWHNVYHLPQEENVLYTSASLAPDRHFWIACRRAVESRDFEDLIVTRSADTMDVAQWTPYEIALKHTDKKGIAPQIIGLEQARAFVIAKLTEGGAYYVNFNNGSGWSDHEPLLSRGSTVWGDDRRMCAVYEPKSAQIHVAYVDDNHAVRYRVLSKPYGESDWAPPLGEPGRAVADDIAGRAVKAYTCVLSIDTTRSPAWVYLLYGETKYQGKDPRDVTGEFRMLRLAEGKWSRRSLLMTEKGTKYNWYPTTIQYVDRVFGILYLRGARRPWEVAFAAADRCDIDAFFDSDR